MLKNGNKKRLNINKILKKNTKNLVFYLEFRVFFLNEKECPTKVSHQINEFLAFLKTQLLAEQSVIIHN